MISRVVTPTFGHVCADQLAPECVPSKLCVRYPALLRIRRLIGIVWRDRLTLLSAVPEKNSEAQFCLPGARDDANSSAMYPRSAAQDSARSLKIELPWAAAWR